MEPFVVVSLDAPGLHCVGIAPAAGDDAGVIVTVQGQGVSVYNIADQRCLASYAARPRPPFTHHAVQLRSSGWFFAARDGAQLHAWPPPATDAESSSAVRGLGARQIAAVHVLDAPDRVLVLLADGAVVCVTVPDGPPATRDWLAQAPAMEVAPTSALRGRLVESLVWPSSPPAAGRATLWALAEAQEQPGTVAIAAFALQKDGAIESQPTRTVRVIDSERNARSPLRLCACTVDSDRHRLVTLWSDGTLAATCAAPHAASACDVVAWMRHLQPDTMGLLPAPQPDPPGARRAGRKRKSPDAADVGARAFGTPGDPPGAALAIADDGHVALALPERVTAWSLVFGTMAAECTLAGACGSLAQSPVRRLLRCPSDATTLVVAVDGGVLACPLRCESAALSSAVGSMVATAKRLVPPEAEAALVPLAPLTLNMRELIVHTAAGGAAAWEATIRARAADETEFVRAIDDPVATPTPAALRTRFAQHVAKVGSIAGLSSYAMERTLAGCMRDRSGVVADIVEALLRTDRVSAVWCPQLVPTLLEWHNLALLDAAMQHLRDLPDEQLVQCARYLIGRRHDRDVEAYVVAAEQRHKADATVRLVRRVDGADAPADAFMHLIVSAPCTDTLLLEHLRALSMAEVLVLLDYLKQWLVRYNGASGHAPNPDGGLRVPTLAQVIDWTALTLDAHLAMLILADDCHAVLADLAQLVQQHVAQCDAMQELRQLLLRLEQPTRASREAWTAIGTYCIELLHI